MPSFLKEAALLGGTCLEDKAPLGNAFGAVELKPAARRQVLADPGPREDSCAAMPRACGGALPPARRPCIGPGGSGAGEDVGRRMRRRRPEPPAVAESEQAAGASAPPRKSRQGSARCGGAGAAGRGPGGAGEAGT